MDRQELSRLVAADWYRALSLRDRLAPGPPAGDPAPGPEGDGGRLRLEAWRNQRPFGEAVRLDERLALDGLDEGELLDLLSEPADALRARLDRTLPWAERLERAVRSAPEHRFPVSGGLDESQRRLVALALPLADHAYSRLMRGLRARARQARQDGSPEFDPERLGEALAGPVAGRLLAMVYRVLVLELHALALAQELPGDDAEDRFRRFTERLEDPETVLGILREYPVLARQLDGFLDRWVDGSLRVLDHLAADWPVLRETVAEGADPGELVALRAGLGDRHRGGGTTARLTFASGLGLIYKPRSLAVDAAFQRLVEWLGARGGSLPLRTLRVVDRGDHGWVEQVRHRPCRSPAEVARFYHRQGSYLALFHLLHATDLHHENLVAEGEQPVFVDLETLFHPFVPAGETAIGTAASAETGNGEGAGVDVDVWSPRSVLRVGLLPRPVTAGDGKREVDLTGLGARPGQKVPTDQPDLVDPGTDRMRVELRQVELPVGDHRPTLDGAEVELERHLPRVVEGFLRTGRFLARHRDELLAPDGPLRAFADVEVRVLLRPTEVYNQLRHASYHPDHLRDGLDRDRLFDRLWVRIPRQPVLRRVVADEVEDLNRDDIPYFTARPGARDLITASGRRVAGFFAESGLELAVQALERLDERELARQRWVIEASFESLAGRRARPPSGPAAVPDARAASPPPREALIDRARAVGDRLAALAFDADGALSWLSVDPVPGRSPRVAPVPPDLYDGLAGIALFLSFLGARPGGHRGPRNGERAYGELGRRAWATARSFLDHPGIDRLPVGAFNGWGGLLYAQLHLAALWGEEGWLDDNDAIARALPARIERDEQYDVIGGSAGCILALLAHHRHRPSDDALRAATAAGDHLLRHAVRTGPGLGWAAEAWGNVPLCGLSHGAAGIGWALLELAEASGAERFRGAGLEALAFERSRFSADGGAWPDLRPDAGDVTPCAWCHGAPGIGLARLAILPHLDGSERATAVREIRTAVELTLERGFGHGHSLCHGDAGNLELIRVAAETFGDERLRSHSDRLAGALLRDLEDGTRCGLPTRVDLPGLMLGLAGIGYQLLRWAEPERVPSVLLLEPPPPERDSSHGSGSGGSG